MITWVQVGTRMPLHLSSLMAPLMGTESGGTGEEEGQAGRVTQITPAQGLASSEQTRRVTGWRREKRREMVELKGASAIGDGGQAQCHSHPMAQVPVPCWIPDACSHL